MGLRNILILRFQLYRLYITSIRMHAHIPIILVTVLATHASVMPELTAEEHAYFQEWHLNETKLNILRAKIDRQDQCVVNISPELIMLHQLGRYRNIPSDKQNEATLAILKSFYEGESFDIKGINKFNRSTLRFVMIPASSHSFLYTRSHESVKELTDYVLSIKSNEPNVGQYIAIWRRYCIDPLVRIENPVPCRQANEKSWILTSHSIGLYLKELILDEFDGLNPDFSL